MTISTRYIISPTLEIRTVRGTSCRIIAELVTWEECQQYARDLANEAGLRIVNEMHMQLPTLGQKDGRADFSTWLDGCKAPSLPQELSHEVLDWFGNRYAADFTGTYQRQGRQCNPDIASVIIIFELDPVSQLAASTSELAVGTSHTRYSIDESLTGAARKKAIEKARKQEKKGKKAMYRTSPEVNMAINILR